MRLRTFLLIALLMYNCLPKKDRYYKSAIEQFTDSLITVNIDSGKIAGASLLVIQNGNTLVNNSYGYANLEFSVPMPKDASFEIGSVTKQFTAAAILKLVEADSISLEDDFTNYLDFDTKGRKVTIYQLLNHTSGIPGYTELPHFWKLSLHNYDRDSLVRFVEREDFLFEPGERLIYNNTAYFFLGLIIEKVTGKSYEEFLTEQFFEPLGMENTYYCSNRDVRKNKAYGYQFSLHGLMQRPYLDHTWPYAAGSLCSTTKDLRIWLNALHNGEVFDDDFYLQFITPGHLNDGTPLRYAMGLNHFSDFGHEVISHGGGINGFLSDTRHYPEDDLYIICLVNTTGPLGASFFTDQMVWKLLQKEEPDSVELEESLTDIEGKYSGQARGRKITMEVKTIQDGITIKEERNDKADTLKNYMGDYTWRDGNNIISFKNNNLHLDYISGYYILTRE